LTRPRPKHCDPDKFKQCITSTTCSRYNIAESEKELAPPSTAPRNEKKLGIHALLAAFPALFAQ
jgi:hypothetical protein